MHKKAQGVSINVVVVAAIALLILVVLAAIFIGRMGTTREAIESCTSYGGRCFDEWEGCQAPYTVPTTAYSCIDPITRNVVEDQICCLRI